MGKIIKESSNFKILKRRITQAVSKPNIMKPEVKITIKRLKMLKQRISNMLSERESWEAKNKQLSDSLKEEKLANASLQKELFEYKRLHHEAIVSLNSYKMKQQQIREIISAYNIDNNPYPHLVFLSECLTNSKLRIDKINTLLSSGDQKKIPSRQVEDSVANYHDKKRNKLSEPVGRVGPMVKGLLIRKPHIRLERVMLPPSNDVETDIQDGGADMSEQEIVIGLSPIPEEQQEEETPLRQISYRKKKASRLGQNVRRDKPMEDSHDSQTVFDVSNNNNSTASNSPLMNRMESVAVTRLEDLSRLLNNSSLIQVESAQLENVAKSNSYQGTDVNLYRKSQVLMSSDDPLEGCSSWMTNNKYSSSIRNSRFNHAPHALDSSDDDETVDYLPTRKHTASPYTSPLPNPLMNSTANSSSRTYVVKKSDGSDSSKFNETCTSPAAEPDSTSHINLRDETSKFISADKLTVSNSMSTEYSSLDRESSRHKRMRSSDHVHSMRTNEKLTISDNLEEWGNHQSPEKLEKRIRKPKNHAYPGEDEISPKRGKINSERFSVGKKFVQGKSSTGRKSIEKQKKSPSKKVSCGAKANLTSPKCGNDKQDKPYQKNASSAIKSKLASPKSNPSKSKRPSKRSRSSLVKEAAETIKNNKPSLKRSSKLITPRNSETNFNSNNESIKDGDDQSSIRSRRAASKKISYKESPLNVKMRRN